MRVPPAINAWPICDFARRKSMVQPHEILGIAANAVLVFCATMLWVKSGKAMAVVPAVSVALEIRLT